MSTNSENVVNISLVGSEISLLQVIVKEKTMKMKESNSSRT